MQTCYCFPKPIDYRKKRTRKAFDFHQFCILLELPEWCHECPYERCKNDKILRFQKATLQGADFSEVCLRNAQFKYANLAEANFQGANLCYADFSGTILHKANFAGAYLYHTNFEGAKIQGANFGSYTKDDLHKAQSYWNYAEYDNSTNPLDFFEGLDLAVFKSLKSSRKPSINSSSFQEHENNQALQEWIKKEYKHFQTRSDQGKFRRNLFKYLKDKSRCFITGCDLEDVLEAAHIKPYSLCQDDEKIDHTNGILLRADIHTLFDLNLIRINPDKKQIELDDILLQKKTEYSELHLKKWSFIMTNEDQRYPKQELLEWRYNHYEQEWGELFRKKSNIECDR